MSQKVQCGLRDAAIQKVLQVVWESVMTVRNTSFVVAARAVAASSAVSIKVEPQIFARVPESADVSSATV